MSPSGKTLLVIPTYNEAGNLERLLQQIPSAELGVDLLVIDDHSPDGTGAIAERLAARMPLTVMHRPGKLGIGSAHKDGFRYAVEHGYARVMTMDADFAHAPSELASMLTHADQADVVIGSRYLQGGGLAGWSLWRRVVTHTAHWLTTHLLGLPYDCTGGFRLYDVSVFKHVDLDAIRSDGYAFLIELLWTITRQGYAVCELPIVITFREHGASKISRIEILKAVKTLLQLSWRRLVTRPEPVVRQPREMVGGMSTKWDEYWAKAHGTQRRGFYEHAAEFYRRQLISRFGTHILSQYLRNEPTRHYLHAGCGSGGSDQRLSFDQPTFHELDYSIVALQMNRERLMPIRRRFLCGDLLALPYRTQTLDSIFNFGVMEHFEEPAIGRILGEFHRVLKPDGYLVVFWPPVFGLSVLVLSSWLRLVNAVRRQPLQLYPEEVSRLKSFAWVRELMAHHRFHVIRTQFGWRDLFTQVAVVAQKA